ncbi:MAG: hypothetical protein AAGL49_15390, partial [Pseudomonadota bacterium]
MFKSVRRIVTGHDAAGRSVILSDAPPPTIVADDVSGEGIAEVWVSAAVPERVEPFRDGADAPITLTPDKGGVRFRLFSVAPGEDLPASALPAAREAVREAYAGVDGADALVDSDRHPAMHRTQTLDVVVVISGEVTLVLDTEDVVLRAG